MRKILLKEESIPIENNNSLAQIEAEFGSLEVGKIKEELQKIEKELLYRNAREDTNAFCELVMRDQQTSQPFKQARVHRTIQNHISWCLENGYFSGIMAPWGFGKSQSAGSLVTMSDGTRKKIEDIKIGDFVLSLGEKLDFISEKVIDVIYHGKKEVFKVHTRTGREIRCSGTNPFFTIEGWKRLLDLKEGDHIASVRNYSFEGKIIPPKYIPEFLGLMMGNGCCTEHPVLSDSNTDIRILLQKIVGEFNWEIGHITFDQKGQPTSFSINKGKSTVSAKDVLKKYKLNKKSIHKTVPEEIFSWNNHSIAKFIGAYYSCDGWFQEPGVVAFSSASKVLLKSIQSLLLRFEVVSVLRDTKVKLNGKLFDHFELTICGREVIKKFFKSIPIYKDYKKKKIEAWVKSTEGKVSNSNIDLIPNGWWKHLKTNVWSLSHWSEKKGGEIFNIYKNGTNRGKVLKFAELDGGNETIENICKKHILWDKIISIEKEELEEMWDLEVENTHNFTANDIFVHNSSQVLARALDILGKKQNSRIKIVCNIDDHAKQRVNSIREYLDKSEEYHLIYPGVYPDKKEKWGERQLNIQRNTYGATDYSVQAGGIFSSAVSGRCDVLIGDDVVDYKNSVLNTASRKQVIQSWENNWMSRLEPNGTVIYISTPWHKEDCSFKLLQNKRYAFLILEVSQDLTKINVKKRYWG